MKNTGIVRRVDELGRVVIPKELRRTMRIKEGEEMEVFVAPDDTLVLKKYSAVREYADVVAQYVEVIAEYAPVPCLICDVDCVVAGTDKDVKGKRISAALERRLVDRKSVRLSGREAFSPTPDSETPTEIAVSPVVVKGDVLGGVVLYGRRVGETGQKLCEMAAGFLAKQFE
ncbi:MAG: AbrB/MazE/SpoVT family DNA-binding domain-containing protein [Clostridia bacterium]|nr:AbrB/MazE/SpoVT family DNA-binding domain-containing protein [Clostridia bacterium]